MYLGRQLCNGDRMINLHKNRQLGVSLIEILVAMAIALVALLAASQMYVSTRESARVQAMQNRISEDGRFALSMLQRVIFQAGFHVSGATNITDDLSECVPGRAQPCRIITPTSATSMTVRFVGDSNVAANANLIGCDGSKITAMTTTTTLTISSGSSKLQCQPSGGAAVDWVASSGGGTSLVDFKIEYGTDTGPDTLAAVGCGSASLTDPTRTVRDCVADTYALATAQANPAQIVAVKVCLVLRTDTADGAMAGSTYSNCSGTVSNGADNRLYRTFRSTILLRNR